MSHSLVNLQHERTKAIMWRIGKVVKPGWVDSRVRNRETSRAMR